MKALKVDKLFVAQLTISASNRVQNIVEKEKNAVFQHFSAFTKLVFTSILFQDHLNLALWDKRITLSQTTNFRLFQTERVCSLNFKFDENGREVSKTLWGKRRNCSLRAISSSPQCFQKTYCRHVKPGLVWERVKTQRHWDLKRPSLIC